MHCITPTEALIQTQKYLQSLSTELSYGFMYNAKGDHAGKTKQ